MSDLIQIESLVLELLLVVSIVAILVRRFRIPYTVALVVAGLALSFREGAGIELTPELILTLLLPPLVFEAALHIRLVELRRQMGLIALLAVPGVVLNMLVVGGVLSVGAGLPIGLAFIFGALIAATDPVSVVAIFRRLGAPKRLEVLLESESLFNDGTAIVLFSLAIEAVRLGQFSLFAAVTDFVRVAGGGILVGLALGWLISRLVSQVDDYLVETTLTTVLAFGSYLIAEQFHMSGVLAVVAAGLMSGNLGEREMSPTTRIMLTNFWEYVAFLANSAVFLLIGLRLEIVALISRWQLILWAIAAVLVGRAISVYGLTRLDRSLPKAWRHVLFWGGLRGAIALALALSLPENLDGSRETVIVMAYGVVLFSLVAQGMTMNPLLRRVGLIVKSEEQIEYERRHARALAARSGFQHLRRLSGEGLISAATWRSLEPMLEQRMEVMTNSVQEVLQASPELRMEEIVIARREMLRAQRSALGNIRRSGAISDETYGNLVTEIDMALETDQEDWVSDLRLAEENQLICQLIFAVLQPRDLESATNALAMRGMRVTQINSHGAFSRERNALLLIGIPEGMLADTIELLDRVCKGRSAVVSLPQVLEGASKGEKKRVDLHAATIFALDVERCEVI
jgi:CPA1 family monovalent cation:H+ antiporter